jgi:hypothetical protein
VAKTDVIFRTIAKLCQKEKGFCDKFLKQNKKDSIFQFRLCDKSEEQEKF